MSVIPLTLFFSLLLAGIFVTLFALVFDRRRFASAERESLLPLADESAHAGVVAAVPGAAGQDHDENAGGFSRAVRPLGANRTPAVTRSGDATAPIVSPRR